MIFDSFALSIDLLLQTLSDVYRLILLSIISILVKNIFTTLADTYGDYSKITCAQFNFLCC